MANKRSDPKVRAYINEHAEEVKELKGRLDRLLDTPTELLLERAVELGVDLKKVRSELITKILLAGGKHNG